MAKKAKETIEQTYARIRGLRENRCSHPKPKEVKRKPMEYESTMVVRPGRKLTGSYKTARQVMDAYEEADWGELETRHQMFEIGKGRRFTKRANVSGGKRFNENGEEVSNRLGRVITVKRFHNSRATCVCKSIMY